MRKNMEKFASQAASDILSAIRQIAIEEGKPLQTIIDEALRDLIEKKKNGTPRKHILNALNNSISDFDSLYQDLAK